MTAGFAGIRIVSERIHATNIKQKDQIMFNKYTSYKEKATVVKWKEVQNLETARKTYVNQLISLRLVFI